MKLFAIASMIVLGLAACGGSEETTQAQGDTVDACWQEMAEEYESAALLAESTIQDNMPVIIRATADMVKAGEARDTQGLRAGHQTFSEASDSMLLAGDDFAAKMERADALCD